MSRPPEAGGFGWRLPTLIVAALLVGLVTFARLGMHTPTSPSQSLLPPNNVAVASPAASEAPPTPITQPVTLTTSRGPDIQFIDETGFASTVSPWPGRFADGIPSTINGEPVHRVNETLNLAVYSANGDSGTILIGGWYAGPKEVARDCEPPRTQTTCPSGQIADSPLQLGDQGVLVDGAATAASGPIVIRGNAHTECAPLLGEHPVFLCPHSIRAMDIVWRGDELTAGGPVGVMPLLQNLAEAVRGFDPQPYHDQPACLLPRPAQAYRSDTGKIQFVFVFGSTEDRIAGATSLLLGPPYGDIGSGCDKRPPLDGKSGWISGYNVILRVSNFGGAVGDYVRGLLNALGGGGHR